MQKIILSLCVISLLFAGCSDDDEDDKNCDLNNANIAGAYKTTAVTYKATPTSPVEDEFSTWDACEKDDLTVLNANGTGNNQDVGVKCVPPGDDTFTWTLNGSTLTIDGIIASTVTSFDCSTMKITYTDPFGGVTTSTVVRQ